MTLTAFTNVFPQRSMSFFGGSLNNKLMFLQTSLPAVLAQRLSHWITQKEQREKTRWHEQEARGDERATLNQIKYIAAEYKTTALDSPAMRANVQAIKMVKIKL